MGRVEPVSKGAITHKILWEHNFCLVKAEQFVKITIEYGYRGLLPNHGFARAEGTAVATPADRSVTNDF